MSYILRHRREGGEERGGRIGEGGEGGERGEERRGRIGEGGGERRGREERG